MQREHVEHLISDAVQWLRLGVEAMGALIVAIGVLLSLGLWLRGMLRHQPVGFNTVRLVLARYLALALEFQLGADILSTAVAPTWDQIGKLGAIAVIRTVLNFFLEKEIRQEQEAVRRSNNDARAQPQPLTASNQDA